MKVLTTLASGMLIALSAQFAHATGMQPETSVVILNEDDGETSINVKNTDRGAALLYTVIENIPEDDESLIILSPPVARVEAGETQLVRFLRQGGEPVKTQRLKRVIFEGIPQKLNSSGQAVIGVTVRQNIPVIINPKGLERNREPWTLLKWSTQGGKLIVNNDSPYVVRMAQQVEVKPSGEVVMLPRAYVLPGDRLEMPLEDSGVVQGVTLAPATVYGYTVEKYDAPVSSTAN